MIPEPMPSVCWVWSMLFGSTPCSKIRTTDGPALAATSMIAEDSSSLRGWLMELASGPAAVAGLGAAGWSNAPVAFSAATVPPEASTAARRAAPITEPAPGPRRVDRVTGGVAAPPPLSNQRSGVDEGPAHDGVLHD